uniref:Uncharacterized protein n=1 Tax=Arundo donax TaxID=35708 RepID=A0A0A8YXP2_ARUDO
MVQIRYLHSNSKLLEAKNNERWANRQINRRR